MAKVSVNLVVLNGEKYIRQCLDTVLAQSYRDFELIIFDNGSTDGTLNIISDFGFHASDLKPTLIKSKVNLATWGGFEESLKYTTAKYSVLLSVDVRLDQDFLKNAVEVMEQDEKIGALQAKILQYRLATIDNGQWPLAINHSPSAEPRIIDTVGFKIFRNRRLINIGQGEEDRGQYDGVGSQVSSFKFKEIFGVEGAVPVFRRAALDDCRIPRGSTSWEIVDHDMFWYGDDLDLVWRMRLLGWKQVYTPSVLAWHDRSTTKGLKQHWYDYFARVGVRRQIPIRKRRLDWRNYRLAMVKNEYMINFLRDLPWIAAREIMVLGYALLFEPAVLLEIPTFFRLLPKMLRKRREIMRRAKVKPRAIRQWFSH